MEGKKRRGWRIGNRRRVPVLSQLSRTECGAACLAMILGYYGRRATVAEVREACGIGRDGVSALTMVEVARGYGLRAKAYAVEAGQLGQLRLPAILHWGGSHFVVLESWAAREMGVVDPAMGRLRVSREQFQAGFTGVALTFAPGEGFEARGRAGGERPLWGFFARMFSGRPAKGLLVRVLFASVLLQAMGLLMPLATKVVVDGLFARREGGAGLLMSCGLSMAGMAAAQAAAGWWRSRALLALRRRLDAGMTTEFVGRLVSLPFQFFQQRTSGDLLARLTSNSLLREALTNQTLSLLLDGAFILVYLAILLPLAPAFAAVALAAGGLQLFVALATRGRSRQLAQRELSAGAEERSFLIELVKGIAHIKASGAERAACEQWAGLFRDHLDRATERGRHQAAVEAALGGLRSLAPVLLLWIGASEALAGRMSVGTMLGLQAMAIALLTPIASLIAGAQPLQTVAAHAERLIDVLRAAPEQEASHPRFVRHAPRGEVELRDVAFRYSAHAPIVLKRVSCRIEPGQKVALVGASGSGKSTLAWLLLGLFPPIEGGIRFDGLPLPSLDYRVLRSHFGVVLQDSPIFAGSIARNILFSNPRASVADAVEAARRAGLHEEILRMPMGYETLLAEGGANLSGGQRQRLALARALARAPRILLLDEATSHLDAVTEAAVHRNLDALGCTRIVIAHRLSAICDADQILVLDQGAIVEQGSHRELSALGGRYAALLRAAAREDGPIQHIKFDPYRRSL
ncbi:MAG: peptidase domain-containing ABC transporter [Blastocatellia bacterium]|nr:peptidase domain-containing ABC transporter [Blastocatellia bacterium]